MTFERENRYIVFKISDLNDALSRSEEKHLYGLSGRIDRRRVLKGRMPLNCVVVESDWPEYKPTWDAIRRRMEGEPTRENSAYALGREAGLREAAGIADRACNGLIDTIDVYPYVMTVAAAIRAAIPSEHIDDANKMAPSPPNIGEGEQCEWVSTGDGRYALSCGEWHVMQVERSDSCPHCHKPIKVKE